MTTAQNNSLLIHRAFELAAIAHSNQTRKGRNTPYLAHPAMVALLLQRAGFDDETIAAGVLHDVVEDAGVPLSDLEQQFSPNIARLVGLMSENKHDRTGNKRGWEERKQEHFETLCAAPVEARGIALADKLHNLTDTLESLSRGENVWANFNAEPNRWLWNAERVIEGCGTGDLRLEQLRNACRTVLAQLKKIIDL